MTQDLPDEMFRWIVEAMPEAVVYSDRDGTIRLWNRGAETIFGYRREEALGRTLDLIIPELWRARHREGYREGMRTGVTRYGREVLAVPASRSVALSLAAWTLHARASSESGRGREQEDDSPGVATTSTSTSLVLGHAGLIPRRA
jgi:PAS domain S-box-containing protein